MATISHTAPSRPSSRLFSSEGRHRIRLAFAWMLAIGLILTVLAYGFDYYRLALADRPISPKHGSLRPSGSIGVNLGFLGLGMFLVIFLYPLRKRWMWLSKQGSSRRWLDFHVLLGLSAPFVIALHSSFKFGGFAGMAFWIMVAVSLSGVIGRYVYGQIPRSLNTAAISLQELQDIQSGLMEQLAQQKMLPEADVGNLLRLPTPERVQRLPIVAALAYMLALDVMRPFQVARLRRHSLTSAQRLLSLGGMLRTRHAALERAIKSAASEAALAKRILFLSRSQQVFHLWHVIHRPFSYSFALLAVIHIVVVMMMGYL